MAVMGATFFSPKIAVFALISVVISNILALALHFPKEHIEKGYYGFNGVLIGGQIGYLLKLSKNSITLLIALTLMVFIITVFLNYIFLTYLNISPLTLPFVFGAVTLFLALKNYETIEYSRHSAVILSENFKTISLFFKTIAIIFFQPETYLGILISIILIIYSRILFILAVFGFFSGIFFYSLLGNQYCIENVFIGFNFIFVSIALGGVFIVPSIFSFITAFFGVILTALSASALKTLFLPYGIPILILPFNLIVILIIITLRQRPKNMFPKLVEFIPGRPEDNLNYYLKYIKRFDDDINSLEIPIKGQSIISQGFNGDETHKDLFKICC